MECSQLALGLVLRQVSEAAPAALAPYQGQSESGCSISEPAVSVAEKAVEDNLTPCSHVRDAGTVLGSCLGLPSAHGRQLDPCRPYK